MSFFVVCLPRLNLKALPRCFLSEPIALKTCDSSTECAGSACTAHSVELSHVLRAIGSDKKHLGRALRFSLGKQTTKKDIDYLLEILPKVIGDLKKRYS